MARKPEEQWFEFVQKDLADRTEFDDLGAIMWSAYHALRCGRVGEPIKCIEALLP